MGRGVCSSRCRQTGHTRHQGRRLRKRSYIALYEFLHPLCSRVDTQTWLSWQTWQTCYDVFNFGLNLAHQLGKLGRKQFVWFLVIWDLFQWRTTTRARWSHLRRANCCKHQNQNLPSSATRIAKLCKFRNSGRQVGAKLCKLGFFCAKVVFPRQVVQVGIWQVVLWK